VLKLLQPVRYLVKVFLRDDSPKQLALGTALGAMIGLIPKGNLIVACLTATMFALRVNLGAGLLMIFWITAMSSWLDPLTHAIGLRILANPLWHRGLAGLFEIPLVPWTSLNNTVVMGGFVLGSLMFYPVFHISECLFRRYYGRAKYYATYWKKQRRKSPVTSGVGNQVQGTHA
jgi:uncharacterized protein (TIGR03546 family)